MKEYISTIIYISIFSIILELILPNNKLKKYISSLMGILVVLTISSPLVNFLKEENVVIAISNVIDEFNITEQEMKSYDFSKEKNRIINNSVKSRLEQEILATCQNDLNEFYIKDVSIKLNDEYIVKEINVTVNNIENVQDASKIINYITDTYNVQEQVINIIKGD